MVAGGTGTATDVLQEFVVDLALSTVLGVGFGIVLSVVVSSRRAGIWQLRSVAARDAQPSASA